MIFIFFAPDFGALQKMLRDVVATVRPAGFLLQPTKCQWSTNEMDCHGTVSVFGRTLIKAPAYPGLEILGTIVALSADPTVEHEKGQSTLLSTAGAQYLVRYFIFEIHLYLFLWSFIYMSLCWCCVRCGRSSACNVVGAYGAASAQARCHMYAANKTYT